MKDGLDDRVFDSLMEEMLTNQHPPDLTDLIQQRLREELGPELWQQLRNGRMRYLGPAHASNASPVAPVLGPSILGPSTSGQSISPQSTTPQSTTAKATPVSATPIIAPPVPSGKASPVIATAVRPGAPADSSISPVDASRLRPTGGRALSVAMATLAAGTLIALSIWALWPESDSASSSVAQSTPTVPSVVAEPTLAGSSNTGNGSPTNGSINKLERAPVAPSTSEGNSRPSDAPSLAQTKKGEELSLENLPFNAQPKQLEVAQDAPKPTRVAVRLSDAEVATAVDAQFEKLWQSQQLDVKPAVAREEVLVRMSAVLVDQPSSETSDPTAAVAEKLVRTATFAEHWADRIAEYWLRGTAAADRQDAAGQALRSYLAQQIVARRPWNEVVAELINSPPDQPSSAFLASLAGGDNHRLAGRVGSALLDEALACARCHDASDNGRVISMDQDEYWSLVALFTGVDGQAAKVAAAKADEEPSGKPKAQRVLLDKQPQLFADGKSPGVFFDRPDGRLQAAGFRLPGGDNWRTLAGVRTPRESLARWMATTSVTDQAAVNLAWRLVFGRPLVAQHAALDGEGLTQRREILITLSEQFQAHDRDMARLVSWLVTTRPFVLQGLDVDRTRWLVASDVEIDRWNKTATNFAAFVPTQVQRLPTLELALASVDRWSDSRDQRRATLAQPTPDMVKIKIPTVKPEMEPSATYLIRSLQPSPAQSEFIDRLVASKLSWIQQVDHIAGLVGESAGNARLHRAAQQILDAKNGDRSAALFQLLQGALLCHESL